MKSLYFLVGIILISRAAVVQPLTMTPNFEPAPEIAAPAPLINPSVDLFADRNTSDYEVDVTPAIQSALDSLVAGATDRQAKTALTAALAAQPTQSEIAASPQPAASAMSPNLYGFNSNFRWLPRYRRRLHCQVTYRPMWKICCWFVWWWFWY